jgi:LEA14-like dessication related protein
VIGGLDRAAPHKRSHIAAHTDIGNVRQQPVRLRYATGCLDRKHRNREQYAMHIPRFTFTAAFILLAAFASGCQSLDDALKSAPKPDARIVGADLRNLSLKGLDLVFDIEITNPYGVKLPIVNLNYVVGSGDRQLLEGGVNTLATVPANGSSVIQVPARLDFTAVIETLSNVSPGSILPYHAEFTVAVGAPLIGSINLPLKHEGEIPIPALPEIRLASFDIGVMTWEELSATARLRVKNTNQFQIDIEKLQFELELGEETVASASTRSSYSLGPGQSAIVEIPISFSPRAFGASITGIFDMLGGSKADYGIAGKLDVGTRFGPLSLPFSKGGETAIQR